MADQFLLLIDALKAVSDLSMEHLTDEQVEQLYQAGESLRSDAEDEIFRRDTGDDE